MAEVKKLEVVPQAADDEKIDKRMSKVERTRKSIADEVKMLEGPIQIRGIEGLDVIPNKIKSTPPDPMTLKPTQLWVDRRYQRSHLSRKSMNLIYKIVSNWDWTKFKPPVVTRDNDGHYLVIDGQHTAVAAATHPDIKEIPVMFVPLKDMEDQARSFIGHNMDRVPVANLDLYYARIASGEEIVLTADSILRKHGISVVRSVSAANHQWDKNQTMATAVFLRLLEKYGIPKFTQIVEFISQCGFSQIRADHWKFAESLLASNNAQNQIYTPSMMIDVVRAIHETDAYNEARKLASSLERPIYQGMTLYYQLRYREFYKIH